MPEKIADVLDHVCAIDLQGNIHEIPTHELGLEDRGSIFKQQKDLFVVLAYFRLTEGSSVIIKKARKIIHDSRMRLRAINARHNPYTKQILGFTFVNNHSVYKGMSAKDLIANSGLRRSIIDSGMIHDIRTPNIICNTGVGTPWGYLRILDRIRNKVAQSANIDLQIEIDIVR